MACVRHGDLPREWRHSGRPDQKSQQAIRKRGRPTNPPGKGARVSGDESRLSRAGQGKNQHDRLSKKMDNMPDKYQGRSITPVEKNLFKVNEAARKLSKKDAQEFHTIVSKILFVCKRERTDILAGVTFLTMRVRHPKNTTTRNWHAY